MSERPQPELSAQNWRGRVYLWDEQALFVGTAAETSLHESPAIKICVSLDQDFFLKTDVDGPWRPFSSAIIAPGQYHAIDGRARQMAMLVTVPEARLAQPINHLFSDSGISRLSDTTLASIRHLFSSLDDTENASEAVCVLMLEKIAAELGSAGENPLDARVAKSIDWIRSGREQGFSVKEIAAGVDLSESRFSHLFSENVRVPVRRYLLWLRLREAMHAVARGVSLTDSAYDAGFADSSHLTRTCRAMLGITPTALIKESNLRSFLK